MYLSSLVLRSFRNYADLEINFSPGLNVIFGNNAQGKTNLLESIYFLATGKSHRTSHDLELIQEGQVQFKAKASVVRNSGTLDLELNFDPKARKQLKINGIPEKKIARLVGNLAAVFFSPDDLQLVKGAPAGRRRFLDIELSQLSQTYLYNLMMYNRVLVQRNTVLRQSTVDQGLLSVYDEQLLHFGGQLVSRRAEAVARLSAIAGQYHGFLSSSREQLRIEYQSQGITPDIQPEIGKITDHLRALLRYRHRDELRRQVTLVGPHRDDLVLWINDKDARLYASQGQQRTAVLALKLAELQFMAEELGEYPILLLDDVASELDPHRRQYLLNAVQDGVQTFVSCTDLEDLMVRKWPDEHRLFRIRSGSVEMDGKGLT